MTFPLESWFFFLNFSSIRAFDVIVLIQPKYIPYLLNTKKVLICKPFFDFLANECSGSNYFFCQKPFSDLIDVLDKFTNGQTSYYFRVKIDIRNNNYDILIL